MKSSTIRYRVADFLRQHPPFNEIPEADLLDLVMNGRVKFHESEEYIFRQGSKRSPYIYVIQQGSVQLLEQSGDRELLHDLRGEGDLVGIGQLVGEKKYLYSAMSSGDVMLYAIPWDAFFELIKKYPKAARYLAAYFSVKTDFSFSLSDQGERNTRREAVNGTRYSGWLRKVIQIDEASQAAVPFCHCDATIADAAGLMIRQRVRAVAVLDRNGNTQGLVTLEDLRDCIAADDIHPAESVSSIMSRELAFAPPDKKVGDYLIQLILSRKSHIAITLDGQKNSKLLALLDEGELTLHCGHNPIALSERIECVDSASQLKSVRGILTTMLAAGLEDSSAMAWYSTVLTQFDALILRKIIQLAEKALTDSGRITPEIGHAWLLFGMAGRRELLIYRRPRWGLIYADPDEKYAQQVDDWFAALNVQVARMVEEAGYPARKEHTRLYRSLSSWKEQFSCWISDPIMSQTYLSLDMFDLTLLCGDNSLVEVLQNHIKSELERNSDQFIRLMANDAMAQLPPLTFFQGQVVEDDGERHDQFDLRHTTLQPLIDVARVFSLEQGLVCGAPTDLRLEQYAELQPAEGKLFRQAAESFRVALRLQAMAAMMHNDESRQVNPLELDKYDQQLLKSVFRDILALLKKCASHFQLTPRR